MTGDLFGLFALLCAAVAVWVLRERHRRRHEVRPVAPDITMAEAWEMWRASVAGHPDRVFATPADATPPPGVAEALQEIERAVNAADYPRAALRAVVLDLACLALLLDAAAELGEKEREGLLKGYKAGMDGLLRDTVRAYRVECLALRWYGHMKYDDAVPGDWFHHYLSVARPYLREKVRLAREHLLEVDESAGRFAQVYDRLIQELREEMLKARPKRRFPPSDLGGPGAGGRGPGL